MYSIYGIVCWALDCEHFAGWGWQGFWGGYGWRSNTFLRRIKTKKQTKDPSKDGYLLCSVLFASETVFGLESGMNTRLDQYAFVSMIQTRGQTRWGFIISLSQLLQMKLKSHDFMDINQHPYFFPFILIWVQGHDFSVNAVCWSNIDWRDGIQWFNNAIVFENQ